jgi:signal transduction histidine kinase
MSVSVGRRRRSEHPSASTESSVAKVFLWGSSAAICLLVLPGAARLFGSEVRIIELLLWAAVVASVDLLPVWVWRSVSVSMSFPVTLAAGMLFPPAEAALIAFLGSFDPRELRGQVSLAKSVFNRSQVAASVMAGSALFHLFGVTALDWPTVLLPGSLALGADALTNALLVVAAVSIQNRTTPTRVLAEMFGSSPWHYVAGYLLLGLLSLPFAASVAIGRGWVLLLFLAPLLLTREMFRQRQEVLTAQERLREKDAALVGAAGEVVRERREERLRLAGELHDEVLPSVYRVHLMGQVLKQDLARGQLLDLDKDLPDLLVATEEAQRVIRELLGDLRRSPIGAFGLVPTLQMLIDQLPVGGTPLITMQAEDPCSSSLSQLLAYQVIREALHNAAKHAKASHVFVRLWRDQEAVRLSVADDGLGFDVQSVDRDRHFGLLLMTERVEAAGGRLVIDSMLGRGTTVAASIPAEV